MLVDITFRALDPLSAGAEYKEGLNNPFIPSQNVISLTYTLEGPP